MSIGVPELVVILVIVLLLFGPTKLPSLGKSMGEAIRGFKKGMNEDTQIGHDGDSNASKTKNSEKQNS